MPDTCGEPHDRRHPAVGADEQPVRPLREARVPVPATGGRPRRVDCEHERAGLLFREAPAGWRQATARGRRAERDRALGVAELLRGRHARAEEVVVACDSLDARAVGAPHEALGPAAARSLVRRLGLRHAPGRGSWLNVAGSESGAMTRRCADGRRLATVDELRAGAAAWQQSANDEQRGADWLFRIDGARTKPKPPYPKTKA